MTREWELHGMATPNQPDHNNISNGTRPHARNSPDPSWTSPARSRAATLRASSSETASLHSLRKRSSFFGRSNSDASSMRRAPATAHSAKSSFSVGRSDDGSRPRTATSGDMRRRKTDPLQSIRDSLFGGKRRVIRDMTEASSSRPTSRGADFTFPDAPAPAARFGSEDECKEANHCNPTKVWRTLTLKQTTVTCGNTAYPLPSISNM